MRARLTSSRLVGRVGELAELELACREAAAGRPTLVLVRGESGVGKSRLIHELETRLKQSGDALMLSGEAVEHGETELPYSALLGLLRPLARQHHPALEKLSPGGRVQLAALLPALDDGAAASGVGGPEFDGSGQLRLFEALLELIALLTECAPLVLCLEDLHWADRSTLTFVRYLARSMRGERLVVLLSYRSDELHRRHPLRPLIGELERLEWARRIELGPFDRVDLGEALADILGSTPSEDLVNRLLARSQGNPLYIEELLAAGLDGRGSAPESLRDAFLLRTERLSPAAVRAVRALAVGRELAEPLIGELTGLGSVELAAALRETVDEQVLEPTAAGTLRFRHELLREAVYDDLLPGERGDLHLALARALERCADPAGEGGIERAATIARHYEAAGDQPAALRMSLAAASAALDVHAYGEAAQLAERALELWPRVVGSGAVLELDGSPIDHVELLRIAAWAHSIGDDRTRGAALLSHAIDELDPGREPLRYAELLGRQARAQWSLNRGAEGVETAQRGLAILTDEVPDRNSVRAPLLSWLARTKFLRGRFRDAVVDGECALDLAIEAGDRYAEGEVRNTLGMALISLGDVERGTEQMRLAIEIPRSLGDIDRLSYAIANYADLLLLRGETNRALQVALDGLKEIPHSLGRSREWMVLTVSEMALEAGDFAQARANLGPPAERQVGIMQIFRLVRDADLALAEGDEDAAERSLAWVRPLVRESPEPQWIAVVAALFGDLERRRGRLAEARRAVAEGIDRLEVCTDDVMRIARVTAVGIRVEADIAQRARDLKDAPAAKDALVRARLHMDRLKAAEHDGGPVERAARLTGAAELTRARGRPDPAAWAAAAEAWDAIERPYQAAVARWRLGEAQAERGDRPGAGVTVAAALQAAEHLGARWLVDELEGLSDRARLKVIDADEAHTAAGSAAPVPAEPFGLTPRELQVLSLLAEGATNRQIGEALFMAEKTASVHVSRILAKLDVRSRTQAAAVAHRLRIGAH